VAALLFFVGLIFILYNLILNLSNLTRIINYCFDAGSLTHYWSLFYEGCFHRRAIYSSVIIAIIGFLVFIVIAPFVLIKGIFQEKKEQEMQVAGSVFRYENRSLTDTQFLYSNIEDLGIEKFECTATGNPAIDFALIMGFIDQGCEKQSIKIIQSPLQTYDLKNNVRVIIPLTLELGEKVFPVYLLYNEMQKNAYLKIKPVLTANHFEPALYFSILPLD